MKKTVLTIIFLLLLLHSKYGFSFPKITEVIDDLQPAEKEQDRDRRHVENSMNLLAIVVMISTAIVDYAVLHIPNIIPASLCTFVKL